MTLKDACAERIEQLFYSRSDEKFIVRAFLWEIFQGRRFRRALDVGPGPGHITGPLAAHSDSLLLVEQLPDYAEMLSAQFEQAEVVMESIDRTDLSGGFDLILLSHHLYYHPQERWLPLIRRLYDHLTPGGELIVIMNSDAGDWWQIVSRYWERLAPHIGFHYKPWSQFRQELAQISAIKTHPYRYQLWIEPGESFAAFVGKQLLEINDPHVFEANKLDFEELARSFKQIDQQIVLEFKAEMVRLLMP